MAELRSFIIGVSIAAAILLVGAVAFGMFGGGDGDSPTAVLLGTPPATRTQQPAVTRTALPTLPAGATGVGAARGVTGPSGPTGATGNATPKPTNTPAQAATATAAAPTSVPPTATRATQPTAAPPTSTPVPVSPKTTYVNAVNQPLGDFSPQLSYLIGNVSAPNFNDESWKTYTIQAAQNVQALAGQIAGISAPSCVSSGAATLVQGANAASDGAGQAIAAINAGNAGALSTAASSLSSASGTVGSGISAIQDAAC